MTLGERIKKLRKALDLTQQQFADRIGSTQNVLANYETGRRNPSSSVVNNICKTFNVREEWLRTGEGEMFLAKPTAALDALAAEHRLSSSDYALIEKFLSLKPETRRAMTDYMREVVASINATASEGGSPDAPVSDYEAEARAEAEAYYRKILAEKAAKAPAPDAASEIEDLKRRIDVLEKEEMAEEIAPAPTSAARSRYSSR